MPNDYALAAYGYSSWRMKLDGLKRRSRFAKPQPMRARIDLTERDLLIFGAIDRHGKLPTNYLYELTKHECRDYYTLQRRLTQLYNGYCDHSDHDKIDFALDEEGEPVWTHECKPRHYLTRDWQQFNNIQARYQPAIYGLSSLAALALAERGRGRRYSPERNDPFVHQFMGACVSASFELACKKAGLRYVHKEEILSHERCPEATRKQRNPFAIPVAGKSLIPDDLFAIEYPERKFRFFAVEIDRNTESIDPKKPVKNSIATKVAAYETVFDGRTHHAHFGIPNLSVLFITTNTTHMHKMLEFAKGSRRADRFLFKAFPTFGENWRVPRELLPVLDPYESAKGGVDISKKAAA